jgi:integrase
MTADTFAIKERTFKEHGCEPYTTFVVEGYRGGKQYRFRCGRDKAKARLILLREQSKSVNELRSVQYFPTTMSEAQLRECEEIFRTLAPGIRLKETVEFWNLHHRSAGEQVSLGVAITRYLGHEENRVRASSLKQKKTLLGQLERFAGEALPMVEITHELISDFLNAKPAANKTKNGNRNVLHHFVDWCVAKPQQFCNHNPVADIKPLKVEKKDHVAVFTPEETAKFMAHIESQQGGKYAKYFAIATFAGIRPDARDGELSRLCDADIDLAANLIRIQGAKAKTGTARNIPITPNLRAWLEKYAHHPLAPMTEREYRKVRPSGMPKDVLRHSWITYRLAIEGSYGIVAKQAGNSEKIIRANYESREHIEKSVAEKFFSIKPK